MAKEDEEQSAKQIDAFGVGCFHFSRRLGSAEEGDPTFAGPRYVDQVTELLGSSSHITDIEVRLPGTTSRIGGFADEDSLNDADGIVPWPLEGTVSFKVLVPKRFQQRHLGNWRAPLSTEQFLVKICYGENLPVTFIYSCSDEIEPSPSTMVVVVRKHLEETLAGNASVFFTSLGPSPYHCDFFVEESDEPRDFDYKPSMGYDDAILLKPSDMPLEKFRSIMEWRISREIGAFYENTQDRNRILEDVDRLMRSVRLLGVNTSMAPDRSILGRIWSKLRPKSGASDLVIATELIEIAMLELEQSWVHQRGEIDTLFDDSLIDPKMEQMLSELREYPIESYRRIAAALDQRLTVASTNRSVLVAAVVSGIVSVVVTLATAQFASVAPHPVSGASTSQVSTSSTASPNSH